ncbi:DUF3240 family protein [Actimicrobium antarcticum]|uniref:DUF3240 family protein n=1 Tax=Actimicrobium antarcticum TaxID=1051899 RepID=A0ABP7T195_9BURK
MSNQQNSQQSSQQNSQQSSQPGHDALLTLAIPITLEEDVLDFLLLHPALASGFSIMDAQGMGQGSVLQSTMERVQGRSTRKLVLIVGNEVHLRQLIAALAQEIRNPNVAYWISPVSCYGRLA